jgi:hypothetical protein
VVAETGEITATITAPATSTINQSFNATSAVTDTRNKAIRVGVGESLFVNKAIPHVFTANYLDGTSAELIAHEDIADNPVTSTTNPALYLSVDNQVLFVDNKIYEVI